MLLFLYCGVLFLSIIKINKRIRVWEMGEIKSDRRIQRTRAWMQSALLKLMKEVPYTKITILNIADEANIARPTFYLHYKTKDELLIGCIDKILDQLSGEFVLFMDQIPQNMMIFIDFSFRQLENHADFFQQVMEAGKEYFILQRFQSYANVFGSQFITEKQIQINQITQQYAIDFFSGSLFTIFMRWLDQGRVHSLASIAQLYYEMNHTAFERFLNGELDSIFLEKTK